MGEKIKIDGVSDVDGDDAGVNQLQRFDGSGKGGEATVAATEHSQPPSATLDESKHPLPQDLVKFRMDGSQANMRLDMSKRNIQLPLIASISDYIAFLNVPLVGLTLSRNALGPEGAALLGKALVTNNTLQFLELEQCDLIGSPYRPQHDGIKALAKGFESVRSTLRYISVADNSLQPEGCRILLTGLSFHPTLTALDISSNALSLFNDKSGYLALSYAIQYAKQLCWLALNDNPLPRHSWPTLQASLANNTTLTSLSAMRCGIPIEQLRPRAARSSKKQPFVLIDLQC